MVTNENMLSASAPGKLILSGEHSVVYGAPAIAVAVNHLITASFAPSDDGYLTISSSIGSQRYSLKQLELIVDKLNQRFDEFLLGHRPVSQILDNPIDLLFYAYAFSEARLAGHLSIESAIPTGAGMGSSAAVIAAILKLFTSNSISTSDALPFYRKVQHCERLQHGRGSAIDAAAVTFGGAVRLQNNNVEPISLELGEGWFRYHSGTPLCSTGETVSFVRKHFDNSSIWDDFADVTRRFEGIQGNQQQLLSLVRANNRLLQTIGVVPSSVAALIDRIERLGGAAKVCGAGAHVGTNAGQVLVYLPTQKVAKVESLLDITLIPIHQQIEGARLA